MTIFVPPPLSNIETIVKTLAPIIDPSVRKEIEKDIVSFHALNATEAKKAEDARTLMRQHQDVLDETKRIAEQNKADAEKIAQERAEAEAGIKAAYEKLKNDREALTTASKDAMALHDEAVAKLNEVKAKEDTLKAEKDAHAIAVAQHQENVKMLENERAKIQRFKAEVLTLDAQTKAKVEALKKFNF